MDKKIYIIGVENNPIRFKIGVSNSIKERISGLQTAYPDGKLYCVYEFTGEGNSAYKIETKIHREFKKFRIGGEWFENIDIDKVKAKILIYASD